MNAALTGTEYRLLVEHSAVMSWRAGLDAKCNYFNETWLAFTGRSLAQEIGDGWIEGVHPDDYQRCLSFYVDHFHRREAFEFEYRLRRHDGEYRWISDRGAPFNDDAGKFAGFIGSCIDIDERRRARESRELNAHQQLVQARDFEKWILAIVSHDIRNPLHAIKLAAHGIKRVPDPQGDVHKQVDVVSRGVKRIEHIVGDLLDLAREREGDGISVAPTSLDLRAMCEQIVEEIEPLARDRAITFECDADGRGTWDEQRVLQAISNLVSNAVQHGTRGTPVRLRLTGDANQVAVEIHNHGEIPVELLPHIFEPFRSGQHHGGRGDGLGLGLFIVEAIARAHGGSLEVDSSDGATRFRLVLPRHTPGISASD